MEVLRNGVNQTLNIGKQGFDWAVGMKPPEAPKGRLTTIANEFLSWITVAPPTPEVWGDGKVAQVVQNIHEKGKFVLEQPKADIIVTSYPGKGGLWERCSGVFNRAKMACKGHPLQAETPHGLKRLSMITVRVGIVLAASALATGAVIGAGYGIQHVHQALASQSANYADFTASALAYSGEGLKLVANGIQNLVHGLYFAATAFLHAVVQLGQWCNENVLPKIGSIAEEAFALLKEGLAWVNEAVVQPAIEALPGLWDRVSETGAKVIPCLNEAAAVGIEYLAPTKDYLYELGNRVITSISSTLK